MRNLSSKESYSIRLERLKKMLLFSVSGLNKIPCVISSHEFHVLTVQFTSTDPTVACRIGTDHVCRQYRKILAYPEGRGHWWWNFKYPKHTLYQAVIKPQNRPNFTIFMLNEEVFMYLHPGPTSDTILVSSFVFTSCLKQIRSNTLEIRDIESNKYPTGRAYIIYSLNIRKRS